MTYLEPSTLPAVPQVKLDLIAAKELIADERAWCCGVAARFAPDRHTIVARCATTAVIHAVGEDNLARIRAANTALNGVLQHRWLSIQQFNDLTSHSDVMKLFDDAIQGVER